MFTYYEYGTNSTSPLAHTCTYRLDIVLFMCVHTSALVSHDTLVELLMAMKAQSYPDFARNTTSASIVFYLFFLAGCLFRKVQVHGSFHITPRTIA